MRYWSKLNEYGGIDLWGHMALRRGEKLIAAPVGQGWNSGVEAMALHRLWSNRIVLKFG
jgi:hypothetical protein